MTNAPNVGYNQKVDDVLSKIYAMSDKINAIAMHLDNHTDYAQMPLPKKGATAMAKQKARVHIGYNTDGSKVYKYVAGNDADDWLDKAIIAVLSSERKHEFSQYVEQASAPPADNKRSTPLFREYASKWFSTYKATKLKDSSVEMYADVIGRLNATFGDMYMDEITTDMLQEMLNAYASTPRKDGKPVAKSSVEKCILTMRQIFRSAYEDDFIPKDPTNTDRLKNPSRVIYERFALEEKEYFDVLQNIPKLCLEDQALLGLMAYTGMRKGEVLGLRWANVDFDKGLIHVRDNAVYPNGANIPKIGTPKTPSSIRDLSITKPLLDILDRLDKTHAFVIGGRDSPITDSSYDKRFARIKRTINLYGATAHIFRHTYGTFLSYQSVGAVDLTAIMGHKDVATTMKYYVHVRKDSARNAERMAAEALMAGANFTAQKFSRAKPAVQ